MDKSFEEEWGKFLADHKYKKHYAHFDRRVSLDCVSVREYVCDVDKVAQHSFYPFIHFQSVNYKYNKRKHTKKKKVRDLFYCSHLDRCVYQRYAFLLNYQYNLYAVNNKIDDVAIAYRNNLGKNNIDFAYKAFDFIKAQSECTVIVGDFESFFDKIDHKYLKTMLCKLLDVKSLSNDYYAVYKNITSFSWWDLKDIAVLCGEDLCKKGVRKKLNSKERLIDKKIFRENKHNIKKNNTGIGIPQGSPISAVLSNIYMIEFDKSISDYVADINGLYMRYSDDFIIVIPKKENNGNKTIEFIKSYIKNFKYVDLQDEKTAIYSYHENKLYNSENNNAKLSYLGFLFDGENIEVRKRSVTKYYRRVSRKIRYYILLKKYSEKGRKYRPVNIYKIYSRNKYIKDMTFSDYLKHAKDILQMKDAEADVLIKHDKEKIAKIINKWNRYYR